MKRMYLPGSERLISRKHMIKKKGSSPKMWKIPTKHTENVLESRRGIPRKYTRKHTESREKIHTRQRGIPRKHKEIFLKHAK